MTIYNIQFLPKNRALLNINSNFQVELITTMFSLAITGLALTSIYSNIGNLQRDADSLTLAIAGLQTNYGRRRGFGSLDLEELLSEGNRVKVYLLVGNRNNILCFR